MTIEIELVDPSDEEKIRLINEISVYAFHPSPSTKELQKRLDVADYRKHSLQYLLFQDGEPVASAAIHPLKQLVRNKVVTMGGVATVGSLPVARRQGLISRLMTRLLREMKQREIAVSALHPFKQNFYQRYDYVTLPDRIMLQITPSSLSQVFKIDLPEMELIHDQLADNLNVLLEFVDSQLQDGHFPGMIRFDDYKYRQLTEEESWIMYCKSSTGRIEGMMIYSISKYLGKMIIDLFSYKSAAGKYHLLQFMAKHIDHVNTIELPLRQSDQLSRWLTDVDYTIHHKPGAMVRIIDVNMLGSLGLEVGKESITMRVIDTNTPWNNGVYHCDGRNGLLNISSSNQKPELEIDIKALSSLVYGNYDLEELRIKKWISGQKESMKRLELLFPRQPHEIIEYY